MRKGKSGLARSLLLRGLSSPVSVLQLALVSRVASLVAPAGACRRTGPLAQQV